VARLFSILLVLGLLGGTAAAFAITEGLKLEKSPIYRTQVDKLFSPTCNCSKDVSHIRFRLRQGDTVTATVITPQADDVATLADHYFRRGWVDLQWNGRDAAGDVVPDGPYKLRIHLVRRHQTITLPNTIQVKTKAPTIAITSVVPRVFSPDHDGRREYVTIKFTVSGTARPLLYADGKQVGRGRLTRASGTLHWFARRYAAGVYRLSLRAEDRAGNLSEATRNVPVLLRFVTLGRTSLHVRPGERFALRVSSDASVVHWLLGGRTGEGAPGTLHITAPNEPGTYRLFVTSNGRSKAAVVVVGG
jgi:hypothetical protein